MPLPTSTPPRHIQSCKYKYLGIEFSSSGSWSSAIANISNPGKKALFLLKAYICSGNIKPGLGLKLFDQMIRPIYFMLWLRDLERL